MCFSLLHAVPLSTSRLSFVIYLMPVCADPGSTGHPTFCGYPGRRDRRTVGRGP
jgi:hypothetical protein